VKSRACAWGMQLTSMYTACDRLRISMLWYINRGCVFWQKESTTSVRGDAGCANTHTHHFLLSPFGFFSASASRPASSSWRPLHQAPRVLQAEISCDRAFLVRVRNVSWSEGRNSRFVFTYLIRYTLILISNQGDDHFKTHLTADLGLHPESAKPSSRNTKAPPLYRFTEVDTHRCNSAETAPQLTSTMQDAG
jgi:hypothetical protein